MKQQKDQKLKPEVDLSEFNHNTRMTLNDNNEYVFRYWIITVYEAAEFTGEQAIYGSKSIDNTMHKYTRLSSEEK